MFRPVYTTSLQILTKPNSIHHIKDAILIQLCFNRSLSYLCLLRDHTFHLSDGVLKTRTCRRFQILELVLTMVRLLGMSITHPGDQRMQTPTLDEMLAALRLEAFKI